MSWHLRRGGGPSRRPLLKRDIEAAQAKTKSGFEAARVLGVAYATYRKYAKMYGLHEQHLNPSGKGITKTHVLERAYPLKDIFEGKHPGYDVRKLKKRLLKAGYFEEKCQLCAFDEKRVSDFRSPLMLVFKDGNSANHALENMTLLCFNCAFLTIGELSNINNNRFNKLAAIDHRGVAGEEETGLSPEEMAQAIEEAKSELPPEVEA